MFDINNLQKMINEKYISVQKHPTVDIFIYNYTQKAQFDRMWNNETLSCRGLIMDKDYNIVARPFKKFFNLEEIINRGEQLPIEDFVITEKMDGSLGIIYWIGDKPYLATRGSFVSEQAIEGTKILHERYLEGNWNKQYTYLFEIILPWNRIVVDYKEVRDIFLLAVVHTQTGEETNDWLWKHHYDFPVVRHNEGIKDVTKLKELQEDNKEGFVIRYKNGNRYKVKFDEYVRLHRLITMVNARSIWDLLRNEQPFDELLERVPDEFYEWVKKTKKDLEEEFRLIEKVCLSHYAKLKNLSTRKEQAIETFKKCKKYSSVIFSMLDKKPYQEIIWKMLRPSAEKPWKEEI
jgi:RNA ligase